MPPVRISLTLSRLFSLSFIASDRSSGLHLVSSHSCCMYVRAGCPAFARPYVGVHRSTPLMSSSLLLQQCLACLVRLTWIVFVLGDKWPYSWCLREQGILCWGFKGVQEEIRSEETCTLQIGWVAFPPGLCTNPQLHPCHRLFDEDGHQDSSSPSL